MWVFGSIVGPDYYGPPWIDNRSDFESNPIENVQTVLMFRREKEVEDIEML